MCCRGCNFFAALGECLGIFFRAILLCRWTSPANGGYSLGPDDEYEAIDTPEARYAQKTRRIATYSLIITSIGAFFSIAGIGLQSYIIHENEDNSDKIDKLVDHFNL